MSESDIRAAYQKFRDFYQGCDQVKIGEIVTDSEKAAQKALTELKKGVAFSKMAAKFTVDPLGKRHSGVYNNYVNLKDLQAVYPNLSLKLSPKLADQIQFIYIKTAQALNISATIVDEAKAHSPYGLIVHSNQAENLDKVLFSELYPDILAPKETEPATEKKGFFAKLFGK